MLLWSAEPAGRQTVPSSAAAHCHHAAIIKTLSYQTVPTLFISQPHLTQPQEHKWQSAST